MAAAAALTSLFLALGTAIGVEGAKSLPAGIQGQSRRTSSGDTGRIVRKNGPDMFCVKRGQSTVCEAEVSAREITCRASCELENFQGLQERVRRARGGPAKNLDSKLEGLAFQLHSDLSLV